MLLVTGITGHTGRYFIQELINSKYNGPIRCIVRKISDTSLLDNSGLKIEKLVGNLNDLEFLNRALFGVDTVLHIYNIHHSPFIVEAAINNNINRAILVHTTGIYSKFKNASAEYKVIEDKVAELASAPDCPVKITILRPTMIYGDLCDKNMSRFINIIDKFKFFPVIDGGQSLIQPVNARDLGRAYYNVFMSPEQTIGKSYILSGDRPIKMIDVFNLISKELGKKRTFINIPLKVGVSLTRILKTLTYGKVDYIEKIQRMSEDRSYCCDNAKRDFGYNPISFEEGMKIEVKQFIENKL